MRLTKYWNPKEIYIALSLDLAKFLEFKSPDNRKIVILKSFLTLCHPSPVDSSHERFCLEQVCGGIGHYCDSVCAGCSLALKHRILLGETISNLCEKYNERGRRHQRHRQMIPPHCELSFLPRFMQGYVLVNYSYFPGFNNLKGLVLR